jgi:hypothetical protein
MKAIQMAFGLLLFLWSVHPVVAGPTNTNPPAYRLTVELWDGSRVIGKSNNDYLKLHSALLGELKLAVPDIRSVECLFSNSAKLTVAGGDTLMVWFADSEVTAQTSFGKVALPVASIRKIIVSAADVVGARRSGLVALWSGEDNSRDAIGGNEAELTDIDFTNG